MCNCWRSDADQNPELREEIEEENEEKYLNYYKWPECGTEWTGTWSCCCNDECPKCGIKDIEPVKSVEQATGEVTD